MSGFEDRLSKAIERGRRAGDAEEQRRAAEALNEQELRNLYGNLRLALTEHIEKTLRELIRQVPGFQFETVMNDRGWGSAVFRDDIQIDPSTRRRSNLYSRWEVVVRPLSDYLVFELSAKGTILNRELLNRDLYRPLGEVDATEFHELVDRWTLEFAELYASKQ